MNGVSQVELQPRGLFDWLLRRLPPVNAGREIQNLVASTPLSQLSAARTEDVLTRYRIRPRAIHTELLSLYEKVLAHVAEDGVLSESDQADLRRLRDALGLVHDDVKQAERVLEQIFAARLKQFLADEAVSAEEEQSLASLAKGLELSADRVAQLRREEMSALASRVASRALAAGGLTEADETKLGAAVRQANCEDPSLSARLADLYRARLQRAAGDRHLSTAEKESLAGIAWTLALPDDVVARIRKEELGAIAKAVFDHMIADRRLSPEEDEEFARVCADLGVSVQHDQATLAALQRFRLLWRIENGELPDVTVPLKLKRNEQCYFVAQASHFEERTVTRRLRYGGPTARIRIAKGVYWRMGDMGVSKVTENVLAPLGDGTLYLTSSRLLFDGASKTTSIALTKIINFQLYKDGVKIEKDSGKDQVFTATSWDSELFGVLLGAALERA